jgi:hypothetical protein
MKGDKTIEPFGTVKKKKMENNKKVKRLYC